MYKKITIAILMTFLCVGQGFADEWYGEEVSLWEPASEIFYPDINASGEITWMQNKQKDSDNKLLFSSTRGKLTPNYAPRFGGAVDDSGEVIWGETSSGYHQIFSLNNGQLTNDPLHHFFPDFNNQGEIVYGAWDSTLSMQVHSTTRDQLTNTTNNGVHALPSINNQGDYVWQQRTEGYAQIFSNKEGQITSGTGDHRTPTIDDKGEVLWEEQVKHENGNSYWQIMSNKQDQITTDPVNHYAPSSNSLGDYVWIQQDQSGTKLKRSKVVDNVPDEGNLPIDYGKVPDAGNEWLEIKIKDLSNNVHFSHDISSNFDKSKPTIVLTHGWVPRNRDSDGSVSDNNLPSWIRETVNQINEEKGDTGIAQILGHRNDINVIAWNWTEIASTRYGKALPPASPQEKDPYTKLKWPGYEVTNQGGKLTKELVNTFGTDYDQPVHFIGHSLGAGVSTVSGFNLQYLGYNVDQVTLFDAPEFGGISPEFSALNLDYLLDESKTANIWVDSYPTAFGKDYFMNGIDDVVSLNIKGDVNALDILHHGYPMGWYLGVNDQDREGTLTKTSGEPNKELGSAWSQVLNNKSPDDWINNARSGLNDTGSLTVPTIGKDDSYTLIPSDSQFWYNHDDLTHPIRKNISGELTWLRKGDVYVDDGVFHMSTSSPVSLFSDYYFPEDSQFLAFDFLFENPTIEDDFLFFIGDDYYFRYSGDSYINQIDKFMSSGLIDISEFSGTNQWLTFVYDSPEAKRRLQLANLNIVNYEGSSQQVVPEPATMLLFGSGVMGLLFRRKNSLRNNLKRTTCS